MQIAIIGAGNVGAALAGAFGRAGHAVELLVRNPADPAAAAAAQAAGARLRPAAGGSAAPVIVLATPYGAAVEALRALGPGNGRIVVDATNPLAMGPDGLGLALGFDQSGGEAIAAACPGFRVVKAFNTTGANIMADAGRFAPRPAMFAAGDDPEARATALGLARDIGFEPVDAGPLRAARLLEAHAMLWIELALKRGLGRDFAFGLLRAAQVG
jgi:hypothetical protein